MALFVQSKESIPEEEENGTDRGRGIREDGYGQWYLQGQGHPDKEINLLLSLYSSFLYLKPKLGYNTDS